MSSDHHVAASQARTQPTGAPGPRSSPLKRPPRQRRTARLWKSRWLPYVSTPIILGLAILGWYLYVKASGISALVLPPPQKVFTAFGHQLSEAYIWKRHVLTTFEETIIGFAAGFVFGVVTGYFMGKFRPVESMANPFVVASQVVPKVALVPLFILWFGFGITSKIVIAGLLAFFPLLTNTSFGIRSVSPSMTEMMTSLQASRWQRFRKLELPHLLPYVLTGSEIGMVLALIGAIVGEYLAGDQGLGRLAVQLEHNLQIPQLYGSILIMTLLGFALYMLIAVLRRILIPWHESVLIRKQRDQG
jgi:NitT/TauT family transport system permease protein